MQDDDKGPKITIVTNNTGAGSMRTLEALALASGASPVPPPLRDEPGPPDLTGRHGRAWLVDTRAQVRAQGMNPEHGAEVSAWLVEAPWAHPCWHSYVIVLVHLRPLPGRPLETVYYLDGATHEMWVFAVDPDADRQAMLTTSFGKWWLRPKNFAAQMIEITDKLAADRVRDAVRDVIEGTLSPDTDHRRAWVARFGANMMR